MKKISAMQKKRVKAYGRQILFKPKVVEVKPPPIIRPKFQPVEYEDWKPQDGVKVIVVPKPSFLRE